ncbi:MAG: hypothetical protein ACK5BW_02310 [Flavobacteriia bacterium]|jgi:hypothetical protein
MYCLNFVSSKQNAMNKKFAIQHIWFNNQDAEVTIAGQMKDDVLVYETKLVVKMSALNGIVSKLQQAADIEVSEYMCRFEFGFITEYEISFPISVQQYLDLDAILGSEQKVLRKIVA